MRLNHSELFAAALLLRAFGTCLIRNFLYLESAILSQSEMNEFVHLGRQSRNVAEELAELKTRWLLCKGSKPSDAG